MERSPGAPVGRALSTAREVLVLLQALRKAPKGMSAEQCARVIGKSRSTATYLLNALRLEGFAIYDSKARTYHASDPLASEPCRARWEAALEEGLSELYRRTGERAYAALACDEHIEVVAAKGRQGLPTIPGLGEVITSGFHALAIGKVLMAEGGLKHDDVPTVRYTERTLTSKEVLSAEVCVAREDRLAVDEEEFARGFCCLAAPVRLGREAPAACLGISVATPRFRARKERLAVALEEVARAISVRPEGADESSHHEHAQLSAVVLDGTE